MHAIPPFAQKIVDPHAREPADTRAISAMEVEVGSHRLCLSGVMSSEQSISRIEEHLRGLGHTTVRGLSLPSQAW
jgi:hypothetical protein